MLDLTNFKNIVSGLVYYLDDINGNRLYRKLKNDDIKEIEQDQEKMGAFLALEFLVIPFLSTKEITSLLKYNLSAGLMIDDIDITERIAKGLIDLNLGDRDNCKKELKNALVSSQEKLTDTVVAQNKKLSTVSDWIRDYVSQIGSKSKTVLNEAQYFYQKSYFINLSEAEQKILKKLFVLYKFLDASSFTSEAFEDDLLIEDKQGKLITTSKGKVVVLYDSKKAEKQIIAKMPQKEVSKNLSEREKQIIELREMASQYPAGSLEHKAVIEEIEKLQKKIG